MAAEVAEVASGNHVAMCVPSSILARQKMLGRALVWPLAPLPHSSVVGRGEPHGDAAVITTAVLLLKGAGTKTYEGSLAHWWDPESWKIPVPPTGEPRAPGA